MRPAPVPALACVSLAALLGGCGSEPPSEVVAGCASGAYRLDTGELLILSPSSEGTLRYRFVDGRSGRLFPQGKGELISQSSTEDFVARLEEIAGRKLEMAAVRTAAASIFVANPAVCALVDDLARRAEVELGVLSNTCEVHTSDAIDRFLASLRQ